MYIPVKQGRAYKTTRSKNFNATLKTIPLKSDRPAFLIQYYATKLSFKPTFTEACGLPYNSNAMLSSISSIKQVYQRVFELNSNQILHTKIN